MWGDMGHVWGWGMGFGMISMVLLVQFLPYLLKRSVKAEERQWLAEKEAETPGLVAQQFRVTNPNCEGRSVAEVNPRRLAQVNLSRTELRLPDDLNGVIVTRVSPASKAAAGGLRAPGRRLHP